MIRYILLLTCVLLLSQLAVQAQTRAPFTNGNTIQITIEGNKGRYEYASQEMLVRYNQNTQKLECILNINNLLPANDSSPYVIAYDLFFAAKHPEFLIEIDAPVEKINAGNLTPETLPRRTRVFFQDAIQEQIMPVLFTPDNRSLMFSTNFDMLLDSYHIRVPAKYAPILTGRIMVSIRNARWVDFAPR